MEDRECFPQPGECCFIKLDRAKLPGELRLQYLLAQIVLVARDRATPGFRATIIHMPLLPFRGHHPTTLAADEDAPVQEPAPDRVGMSTAVQDLLRPVEDGLRDHRFMCA